MRERKTLGRREKKRWQWQVWRSPEQAEWRPFSTSAETRPKKSQAQWTQANEGSHCLQSALRQTIRSILVLLFCILPCLLRFQAHNTIYFSYARWLVVGLRRQIELNDICLPDCSGKSHIWPLVFFLGVIFCFLSLTKGFILDLKCYF